VASRSYRMLEAFIDDNGIEALNPTIPRPRTSCSEEASSSSNCLLGLQNARRTTADSGSRMMAATIEPTANQTSNDAPGRVDGLGDCPKGLDFGGFESLVSLDPASRVGEGATCSPSAGWPGTQGRISTSS
jgi:hypothetical protein